MHEKIEVGDQLRAIFTEPLPGNDYAPPLVKDNIYKVHQVVYDNGGNPHIDVGIKCELNFVRSFATKETLPGDNHWCHPNRFVKLK